MPNILILGEAWGQEEARQRQPFVGYSGQELNRMLASAGIRRQDCFATNVFNLHPPSNRIEAFCGPKQDALEGYPPLLKSKFVHRQYASELGRLADEIEAVAPNVIVALGNTAMWAMLGRVAISKYRGVTEISTHTIAGFKVLPTYHPAAVTRQWDLRPIVILDLGKALRESAYPDLRRPHREVWIKPTLEDLHAFRAHITGSVSVDIETSGNQITCIGFASDPGLALVIPFFDRNRKERSYWLTPADERVAWEFVRGILEDARIRKTFQNGLYDIAFIWRTTGIKVFGAEEDTMLLHHALQPEALKSLGFLGSVYTDEGAWKQMRERTTTIKRDE